MKRQNQASRVVVDWSINKLCQYSINHKTSKIINSSKTNWKMSLRGFSAFEARFRAKMAKSTPTDVLIKKKVKEGLSDKEKADYKVTFR